MSEHVYGSSVLDFGTGDRVELHPTTDSWMKGDRFGTVLKSCQYHRVTDVRVLLDISNQVEYFSPQDLRNVMAKKWQSMS